MARGTWIVDDPPVDESQRPSTEYQVVSPATFSTLDLPILEGRAFDRRDARDGVPVCDLARIIMVSPFVGFITYSVFDGCRIIVAHERRHLEQARRVTREPGFPSSP
jgi:hypothetical protein